MSFQTSTKDNENILKLLEKIYSHKNLEEILQGVADGITVQDPQGNLVYANKAAAEVLGFDSVNSLLMSPTPKIMENFELFDELGRPLSPKELPGRKALSGEPFNSMVVRWLNKKTGNVRWAEVKATPILEAGKVILAVNIFHDLTSYKELTVANGKFLEDHNFIKKVAELSPGMIAVYNLRTGEYVYVNSAVKKLLGYAPEEFIKGGLPFVGSLLHPNDVNLIMKKNTEALTKANSKPPGEPEDESIVNFEYRMRHKNGSYRWLHTDGSVFSRDNVGRVEYVMNISMDITARKEAESKTAAHLSAIINHTYDAIITKDLSGIITSWNKGAERIYGYTAEEVIGKPISLLIPSTSTDELPAIMAKLTQGEYIDHFETTRINKNGERINVSLSISPIRDADGNVVGATTIARDITEQYIAEQKIKYNYYHDPLTDLPNRAWFNEQIRTEIGVDKSVAVFLIDLDRFKLVNESLGHPIGDELIRKVGFRVQGSLTEDCDLARYGGDEFAIIVKHLTNETTAKNLANRILTDFRKPFEIKGHEIYISPSIGICFCPRDAQDAAEIIQCAEVALYYAKEQGKNNYQLYNDDMTIMAGYHLDMESKLRHAIENKELVVHYQPQVSLRTGEILATEALVRTQDNQLRLTLPDRFIPLAEITGLIEPLGEIVMRDACIQTKYWNEHGYPNLMVAINISSRQFKQKEFINTLEKIISETGINPANLELELTERVLIESSDLIIRNMRTMARWGLRFSLDDFSMGHSSLNYIQKFPLHVLKVDRTFMAGIPKNKANRAITQSIINLGHNLGMSVVGEGVETMDQLQFLYNNSCDKVQGYIFNGPAPADSLTEILGEKRFSNIISKVSNPTLPLDFAAFPGTSI